MVSFSLFIPSLLNAQSSCKVLASGISGSYDGSCKKGLADGEGKAQGTDQYTGSFKKGLPDGKGKYTWKSGNTYEGQWSKGEMDGKGVFSYKRAGKPDSVVAGVWNNNVFQENSRQAFIVHFKSAHVSEVEIKRRESSNNNVSISLTNINAGSTYSTSPSADGPNWSQIPPPQLTDITVLNGFYETIQKQKSNNRSTTTVLSNARYPLRVKLEISGQNLDVELLEPGDWLVDVTLDNKYNPDVLATPIP